MSTWYLWWYFLSVLITKVIGQESPCPDLFRYEFDGNQWHGVITLPLSNFGSEIELTVRLSVGVKLPTSYIGTIELLGNKQQITQALQNSGVVTYNVLFPVISPIPQLTAILINDRQYCSGPPAVSSYVTSIDLQHSLYSIAGNVNPTYNYGEPTRTRKPQIYPQPIFTTTTRPEIYQQPVFTTTTRPQIYQQPYTTTTRPQTVREVFTTSTSTRRNPVYVKPVTPPPYQPNIESNIDIEQCGESSLAPSTNGLIVGGEISAPGEWPWLGAVFTVKPGSTNFICSGSLISHTDIITAAHCIPRRKSESLLVKFGLYNINEWSENVKVATVQTTHVHPSYNRSFYHNDIAILKVSRIEYTTFIQPICMGLFSTNSLVGMTGTVVGWGKDENGQSVTPEPKKAVAKVASTEECQRSDPRIIPFTSSKTMCAGNRDGTGPCNGDSGGGLYFKLNGVWTIRGIVSNSLPDKDTDELCGLKDYVLYTDVNKFSDWINKIQER